jgi:universal stress protein A
MPIYKNIVVAIDPYIESGDIMMKAKSMLAKNGNIDVVYVVEMEISFSGAPFAPPIIDLPSTHTKTRSIARGLLRKLAKKHGVSEENTHVLTGSTAKEIRNYALEKKADCITIGSHGRHGIGLLLGSTASSVIHGTPCDILVVKIKS